MQKAVGTGHSTTAWTETTYTYSGAGCSLSASTTYFVVIESGRANSQHWARATTNAELTYPTNSGWSIGESSLHSASAWHDHGNYLKFKVSATMN